MTLVKSVKDMRKNMMVTFNILEDDASNPFYYIGVIKFISGNHHNITAQWFSENFEHNYVNVIDDDDWIDDIFSVYRMDMTSERFMSYVNLFNPKGMHYDIS